MPSGTHNTRTLAVSARIFLSYEQLFNDRRENFINVNIRNTAVKI